MDIKRQLAAIPLLANLNREEYQSLAEIVISRKYERGAEIFSENDPGNGLYLLVSGRVKIYKLSADGREQILHILGPGDPFGEAAVFVGSNFPATASALTASTVFFIPREPFVDLINRMPQLAMNIMASMSRRLKKFAGMIEALSLKEVPARLATHMLFLSSQEGGREDIRLNISKAQLASLLGTIPETLSRILKKMSARGYIEVKGPRIRIKDRNGLEALATGMEKL